MSSLFFHRKLSKKVAGVFVYFLSREIGKNFHRDDPRVYTFSTILEFQSNRIQAIERTDGKN